MSIKVKYIVQAAIIACLYIVTCQLTASFASGMIQVRLAEALTVLPIFTPAAIPGLFIGCLLSNFLMGGVVLDVIFGSLATLIGAILTHWVGRYNKYFAPVPPIVANTIIIPLVIKYAYHADAGLLYIGLGLFAGEVISCGILGTALIAALSKRKNIF